MRKLNIPFFLTLFITTSSPLFAIDFPPIKEGLWQSTSDLGSSGGKVMAKQCFGDKQSLQDIFEQSKKNLQGNCGELKLTSSLGTYTSKIECDLGVSKLTATSVATGDFQRQFNVTTTTSFSPPMFGQSTQTFTGTSVYMGPCEAGMKPGDVVTSDGTKVNILELNKSTPEMDAQKKAAVEKLKNMSPEDMKKIEDLMKQFQTK